MGAISERLYNCENKKSYGLVGSYQMKICVIVKVKDLKACMETVS